MAGPPDPEIASRIAAGDYVGAARAAEAAGDLVGAIRLYERVWRFADAVPLAERLGDAALAVRLALDARDVARAAALAAGVPDDAREALLAVAAVFAGRGRWLEAAGHFARAGADARAAEAYEKAGALAEAARAYVRAGDWPRGGRLWDEVAIAAAATGDRALEAEARLAFGVLCGQLGRPREAARALQVAAEHPATRLPALARLAAELGALELPFASAAIAARVGALATQAPVPAHPDTGAVAPLPRFAELALIGAGSLGRVYRARDRLLGLPVVLKILAVGAGRAGSERQAFRQFLREAEASGRLRHPNIVRVHDLDERAGLLVLEHVPGGTLGERLAREGPLPVAAVRRLALDVLSALAAAHRAGIVHRDVKPANVFFDAAGNAKLADFGAAHLADFGGTQTAGFIGTLGYLSPEQISGGMIGPGADLYALGATLFEALTGRLPYLGPDIAGQHLAEPPPSAMALVAGVPLACDDVIRCALAKNPADRFASAEAMADAVRAWPVEPLRALAPRPLPPTRAATPSDAGFTPTPLPEAIELGHTGRGRLALRLDPRLGRPVLAEVLDVPLDAGTRAAIVALAAAGGPHVQRVLRLDEPPEGGAGATVVYEAIAEPPLPAEALSPAEIAAVAPGFAALGPLGLDAASVRVARTAGGPVILVVGVRASAYPAAP